MNNYHPWFYVIASLIAAYLLGYIIAWIVDEFRNPD